MIIINVLAPFLVLVILLLPSALIFISIDYFVGIVLGMHNTLFFNEEKELTSCKLEVLKIRKQRIIEKLQQIDVNTSEGYMLVKRLEYIDELINNELKFLKVKHTI